MSTKDNNSLQPPPTTSTTATVTTPKKTTTSKNTKTKSKTTTTKTTGTTIMSIEDAIQAYRDRVQRTNRTSAIQCRHLRQHHLIPPVNITPGILCLQPTHDTLSPKQKQKLKLKKRRYNTNNNIQYPNDAEMHYNEIRYHMASYAQHARHTYHTANGYPGPWIENQFITYYEYELYDHRQPQQLQLQPQPDEDDTTKTSSSSSPPPLCLHEIFGPYIPIFLPWTDHQVHNQYQYPSQMISTLLSLLRPNVLYLTVNQNARGLKDSKRQEISHLRTLIPNLVVLSAGGHGHVPIPLLQQDQTRNNYIQPISQRPIDISYVGSLGNAPNQVRQHMHQALLQAFSNNPITSTSSSRSENSDSSDSSHPTNGTHASSSLATISQQPHTYNYTYYYGPDWRTIMSLSKLSLVPRGFGRTAYHLMETLQMGLIPIYVYLDDDVEWIPYRHLYHGISTTNHNSHQNHIDNDDVHSIYIPPIGYSTTFRQVVPFVQHLLATLTEPMMQMQEAHIVSLRDSHFSIDGILQQQIQYFMTPSSTSNNHNNKNHTTTGTSDLVCQALPKFVTGIPKYGQ